MADARESQFQQDIVRSLQAQGWLVGEAQHYDRERALYPQDAIAFFRQACPYFFARPAPSNGSASARFIRKPPSKSCWMALPTAQ